MKHRKAMWAFRGISIAMAVIVVGSFVTVAYSAYADYRGISNSVSSRTLHSVTRTLVGPGEQVSVNLTIPNNGLYTLKVSVACSAPDAAGGVTCEDASVTVPPGHKETLEFTMNVANLAAFEGAISHTINGTVTIEITPFVNLNVSYDLGGLVGGSA